MRRAAIVLLLLTACKTGTTTSPPPPVTTSPSPSPSPSPETFTLRGEIGVISCTIITHFIIQVRDEHGTLIGQAVSGKDTDPQDCGYHERFVVRDLPKVKFYTVGTRKLKGPTFSFQQLQRKHWHVSLVSR